VALGVGPAAGGGGGAGGRRRPPPPPPPPPTARKPKPISNTIVHTMHATTWPAVLRPIVRARMASTVTDTGWWLAKACSQPGMELTGTKAEEAKTRGASMGKAAAWVDSGSPTARPMRANIADRAQPKPRISTSPARNGTMPAWNRKPTR
jgi:hypothetical protein